MKRRGELGLFAGVRETVDRALGVSDFTTKSAALNLTRSGYDPNTAMLVPTLFEIINRNWKTAIQDGLRSPSAENFRWHSPQTYIGKKNLSPEVTIERALVNALIKAGRNDWSNQVPLISGIAGPHAFKKRSVDLVHRPDKNTFEFVELKMDSDTPLYAAVEIVVYSLLWLLSRRDRVTLGYPAGPILDANQLRLSVLAPRNYYHRYLIEPLAAGINEGLHKLGDQHGAKMSFRFTAFPEQFDWLRNPTEHPKPSDEDLIEFLDARESI